MRKIILRIVYAVAVFIAAAFLLETTAFRRSTDQTTAMEGATLPIITMASSDLSFNELHGYTSPRNVGMMRPPLTPLSSSRGGSFWLDRFGTDVESVQLEVRSITGDRLIESTSLTITEQEGGRGKADFALQDLIDPDTEYLCVIVLTLQDERTARYYTRICYEEQETTTVTNVGSADDTENEAISEETTGDTEGEEAAAEDTEGQRAVVTQTPVVIEIPQYQEALQFIQRFHDGTISGNDESFVTTLMETEVTSGTTSLAEVDIHSSYDDVTYEDLHPEEVVSAVFNLREMQNGTYVVDGSFVLRTVDTDETEHYYKCTEYYRIRMGIDRFHLINYKRTMEQKFDVSAENETDGSLQLGVVDPTMQVVASEDGTIIAFVNNGSLYSCDTAENLLTGVFAFDRAESTDRREVYAEHDIDILRVTEDGDIEFIVCGYMNRGKHEGEVGIAEYHYDSEHRTITENIFLQYDGSAEVLRTQIGETAYLSESNKLYVFPEKLLYEIDLNRKSVSVIRPDLQDEQTLISGDGKMVVWNEAEEGVATGNAVLLDLSDLSRHIIEAAEGEEIIPIGFLNEDLIYGTSRRSDAVTDEAGGAFLPMYRIDIVDEELQTLESYEKEGSYIAETEIKGNQITLQRVSKNEDGTYTGIEDDHIVGTRSSNPVSALITSSTSDLAGRIYLLTTYGLDADKTRYAEPRMLADEDRLEAGLGDEDGAAYEYYDVYGLYGYEERFTDLSDAVRSISSVGGLGTVVRDDLGRAVWRRASEDRAEIDESQYAGSGAFGDSLTECMTAILRIEGLETQSAKLLESGSVSDRLQNALTDYRILEISGSEMENILYYPSIGIPVLALTGEQSAVLITGYGPENIAVYDPASASRSLLPRENAGEMFRRAGNRYITYMRPEE